MSLASCPNCSTALRVPDGSAAAVRCPKCKTVFTPAAGPAPAPPPPSRPGFGAAPRPPSPPAPPPSGSRPAFGSGVRPALPPASPPPPPARPPVLLPPLAPRPSAIRQRPPEPEFEVVDAPEPEPEDALSLDEDAERPRKAALLDDDRPRRAVLDDDDDDRRRPPRRDGRDDRPRGRGRGRDDYDDDDFGDYDGPRNPYRPASVGALLVAISLWIYLGVFGTLALVALIGWVSTDLPEPLLALAGVAGLGNWVTALVGLGFLVAGPKKARGVTVAALVLAGVQFVAMTAIAVEVADGVRALAAFGVGGKEWAAFLPFMTLLPVVDVVLPALFYSKKAGLGDVPWEALVAVLGGGCEIARLILVTLAVGAHGRAAKDHRAADYARIGVTTVAWVCGAAVVLTLVVVLMVVEGQMVRSARHLLGATGLLVFVGYSLMLIFPALAAHAARAGLGRKARQVAKADRGR